MKRRGGTLAVAGLLAFAIVACSELREAEPSADAGGADAGPEKRAEDGSVDLHDASDAEAAARPPCPAPCKPERISTIENLAALTVDAANVYFGGLSSGIFAMAKDSRQTTTMGNGTATSLALANGQLFWSEKDRLVACPIAGCGGAPKAIVLDEVGIEDVRSDGTNLAWRARPGGTDDLVRTCPADSCSQGTVKTVTKVVSPRTGLGIGDGRVLWVDFKKELSSCPLAPLPCTAPTKLGPGSNDPLVLGGVAYWTYEQNVVACPLAGCENFPRKIGTSSFPRLVAVDDRDVYWRDAVDHTVLRCPLTGCQGAPEEIAAAVDGGTLGLALDADYVYWTSATGLWRRHK